jgi:hypothetical protein
MAVLAHLVVNDKTIVTSHEPERQTLRQESCGILVASS